MLCCVDDFLCSPVGLFLLASVLEDEVYIEVLEAEEPATGHWPVAVLTLCYFGVSLKVHEFEYPHYMQYIAL